MQITARFPVRAVGDSLVTVVVGGSDVREGDVVNVHDAFHRTRHDGLWVQSVETLPASQVSGSDLGDLALADHAALNTALSRCYGTGLPKNIKVTVFRFLRI